MDTNTIISFVLFAVGLVALLFGLSNEKKAKRPGVKASDKAAAQRLAYLLTALGVVSLIVGLLFGFVF